MGPELNNTKAEDDDDLEMNYLELQLQVVNHSYRVLDLWLRLLQISLGGTLRLTTEERALVAGIRRRGKGITYYILTGMFCTMDFSNGHVILELFWDSKRN